MKEKMIYRVMVCHELDGNEDKLTLDGLYWCKDQKRDMIQVMDNTGNIIGIATELFNKQYKQ